MNTQGHPLVGQVVDGRYRVDDYVARGGMATVYRAMDLRLDRTVALKVMHAGLAEDQQFVDRFVREARSAARLSHPAIVAVYDQGASDGVVYLAMEYVKGSTLRDLLNTESRLDSVTALNVLEPVLEALNVAHQAGFVHRDIKPENVLIADDGRVKVADFGLARAIAASTSSGITRGLLIGTVAYLAPEQVEKGLADARTDVYSSGILLYECLVGQTPYSGDTPLSVAYQHVHANVPVPSSIRSDIPPEVDALVAIATSQNPDDRYTDAGDFVDHLRTVRGLAGAPASTHTIVLSRNESTVTVGPWGTDTLTRETPPAGTPLPPVAPPIYGPPTVGPAGAVPWTPPPPPEVTVNSARPAPIPDLSQDSGSGSGAGAAVEIAEKRRKPRRYRVLSALLVMVLLAAGAGYGAYAWGQAQVVKVPELVGMTQTEASAQLALVDMSLTVSGTDFSKTIPKGAIVSADPAAGTEVRKGQQVSVHTSAGPEMVDVPKLVGVTLEKANQKLATARLTGSSTEEFDDNVPVGKVISSAPEAGTSVQVDSAVTMVVSKGPPPVTVPNVVTLGRQAAIDKLHSLGLKVVTRNQLPVIVFGRVYSQSPGGGTVIPKGSDVTISLV